MKKIFCLAIVLAVFVNVNTFSATKKSSSKSKTRITQNKVLSEPEEIALNFINEYVDYENSEMYRKPEIIYNSPLFTDRFKEMYRNSLIANFFWNCDEYGSSLEGCTDNKIDGEQREFAEIYGGSVLAERGQDMPQRYSLLSYNEKTGIVYLKGEGWSHPNYRVLVKMAQENGMWKIDGAGEINIPKNIIKRMYDNN